MTKEDTKTKGGSAVSEKEILKDEQKLAKDLETAIKHHHHHKKKTSPHKIVKEYMWWSVGAGAIPIPLVDNGALILVQMRMMDRLAHHYGISFKNEDGKAIITSLIGTITVNSLTYGGFTSFIKRIPLLGIVGYVAMPLYSAAITYAIGTLFTLHFSSKGNLLDFDLDTAKTYFGRLYEIGKEEAKHLLKHPIEKEAA